MYNLNNSVYNYRYKLIRERELEMNYYIVLFNEIVHAYTYLTIH